MGCQGENEVHLVSVIPMRLGLDAAFCDIVGRGVLGMRKETVDEVCCCTVHSCGKKACIHAIRRIGW